MRSSYILFTVLILCFVLVAVCSAVRERRPRIVIILLSENRRKIMLEYWQYYSWYDRNGNKVWSKRRKQKPLLVL